MAVHRRQLPLAYRCEGFVPAPGAAGEGGFCEQCQKQVHDVSAMRESELRRLLAAHAGGTVCLAYRFDASGRVRLRPEPTPALRQPLVIGALALLLAACAGHAGELETPGATCRDADGYAVSCDEWSDPGMLSVPEAGEAPAARDPQAEGCPVRPNEIVMHGDPPTRVEPGVDFSSSPPEAPALGDPSAASDGVAPGAEPTSAKARADFSVDPDDEFLIGVVVVSSGGWIDRDFVPTAELWKQWRKRRAEHKAARERWRVFRRTAASR